MVHYSLFTWYHSHIFALHMSIIDVSNWAGFKVAARLFTKINKYLPLSFKAAVMVMS